jgi:pimeloyl-ACP methyl ester carboxylesterase
MMRIAALAVFLASSLVLPPLRGQAPGAPPLNPASDPGWVMGGSYRLKAAVFRSAAVSAAPVLVVVLHGDAPFNKPDYQNKLAARVAAAQRDVVAVALLRPGYTDPQGNTSGGVRGVTNGDNWNATNTDAIAGALGELKRRYHPRRVVVAGHSGGAAITANLLGRHPELIDAALLVSCPCDVVKWRQSMLKLTGQPVFQGSLDTLSAIDQVQGMSDRVEVTMVVGSQDKVAPPVLSESYRDRAVKLGKQVRLVQLEGKEHEIFLEPAVLAELGRLIETVPARRTPAPHAAVPPG